MVLCTFQACREIEKPNKLVDDGVFQKIDNYLDQEGQNGFSGIINIKIKDKPLYTRAFGYANREEKVQINASTVFDIGSLTKQFTAAAILKLEMEEQLRVEDSLIKFFPDIPSDKSSITLHQLLTHTSGLKKSIGYDYARSSKSEFLEQLFKSKLDAIPGTRYKYSHAAYSLLGAVIESVSGSTYEEYLKEKLLDPAGIRNTGYVLPRWEEKQIAHGYRKCKDWGKPMDLPWSSDGPYWNLKANAGLISSSEDLLKWMEAIEGPEIFSEEAREKFFYPHVREGEAAGSFYGYGWVIAKSTRNTDVIAHDGNNRRFYTDLYRYRSEDVTIILQSNLDKPGHKNITFELARIIFWEDYEPQVQGSIQVCMDSLPHNQIGKVSGDLFSMLEAKQPLSDTSIVDEFFSEYLKNRHSKEHILDVLNGLRVKLVQPKIRKVIVTDYLNMEISLRCSEGEESKNLFVKLIFDEEDLKIRTLMYDRRPY